MSDARYDNDRPDLGCRHDLEEALAQPALEEFAAGGPISPEAEQAAYEVAVALGRCRLFGVEPGEDLDGTLSPDMARAAARYLTKRCEAACADVETLGKRWDAMDDAFEANELCIELLEERMDVWAADEALEEAHNAHLAVSSWGLLRDLGPAIDAVVKFDGLLQKEIDLLSVVTTTELLNNWRQALAPQHKEWLPWWLDGTLEEAAERVAREAYATMPSPAAWRRLRETLQARAWLPAEQVPLLAAAAEEEREVPLRVHRWNSPDGRLTARLIIPERPHRGEEESLALTFHRADGTPATELAGQPVTLASVAGGITEQAEARFTLGQLRQSGQGPILKVGPDQTEWPLQPSAD